MLWLGCGATAHRKQAGSRAHATTVPCFAFEGPGGVAGQPGGVPPGRDSSISGGAGTLLTLAPGGIAIALAAAAEAGRFDELRREMFANQPPEHSGGFTTQDLLDLSPPSKKVGTRAGCVKSTTCSRGPATEALTRPLLSRAGAGSVQTLEKVSNQRSIMNVM